MLNEELCARHFTTSAIHIIDQVWARAADRSMGSAEITEQTVAMLLLWSLLRWERKVGLVALERSGVEPDALARDLDRLLSAASSEAGRQRADQRQFLVLPSGQRGEVIDVRNPLEPVLTQAEHEALALGHNYVGSEHLLLALIRRASPLLSGLLVQHSVEVERIRKAALEILGG
jgi:ATP-dependent Clp protease ATP-binding subunit ClpA